LSSANLVGNGTAGSNWVTDFVVVPSGDLFGPAAGYSTDAGNNTGNPSDPLSVAVGDFGNGKPDLAVANSGTNTVLILMNNGDGTFTAGNSYSVGYAHYSSSAVPYGIVAGDFNGDGKLDLAVANYDQTLDTGTIQILLGIGNGTFTAGQTYTSSNIPNISPISIAEGDFNGDGKLDLAVANYNNGTVTVLTGNGNGTFPSYASYGSGGNNPRALAVADFNGDGKLDLAVANYEKNGAVGTVGILLNKGNGTFPATATTYSTGGSNPRSIAAGDFNGDGKPDLAVANYTSGTVGILLNKGNGTFPATATTYSVGGAGTDPRGIVVGDFNGDGKADLAVTDNGSDDVGILLGNGNGGFSAMTTFSTGSGSAPFGLAIGDFNGDGKPDLAATDSGTDAVGILTNTYGPAPVTLTTPNGFTFEIATVGSGAGEFASGSNNAFTGYGRLVVGGTLYQPSTQSFSTADSGQSVLTANGLAAGMTLSREITVPSTGNDDFARTVDTFTNSTASPITTTVQVVSTFGSTAAATVFATSDGSGVVSAGDQWIGTVDGAGAPAIINYIHGPFGLEPSSVIVVGDNIQWTYNLTVAAGQTTQLAYFTILATTQAAAVASANALVTRSGFGNQAAVFLSQNDVQSLANFVFQNTETWIGSGNGNWADSQWSNSPPAYPNGLVDAVVGTPQVVTVDSAQQASSLSISGGGQVTVSSSGSLAVGNNLTIGASGTLVVMAGGTLSVSGLTIDAGGVFVFGATPSPALAVSAASGTMNAGLPVDAAVLVNVTNTHSTRAPIASSPVAQAIPKSNATDILPVLMKASVRSAPSVGVNALTASIVLTADRDAAGHTGPSRPESYPAAFPSSAAVNRDVNKRLWALVDFLAQQRQTSQRDSTIAQQVDDLLLKYYVRD